MNQKIGIHHNGISVVKKKYPAKNMLQIFRAEAI
jgi:hypothetical protein